MNSSWYVTVILPLAPGNSPFCPAAAFVQVNEAESAFLILAGQKETCFWIISSCKLESLGSLLWNETFNHGMFCQPKQWGTLRGTYHDAERLLFVLPSQQANLQLATYTSIRDTPHSCHR
jgi:hypothetical protein